MHKHNSSDDRAPLSGIRVIDFTSMIAGPYCARMLADLGADVIKVEEPGGDNMRTRSPSRDGYSAYFGHLNSGKRSIVLNLKDKDGLDIARRLIESADIVVEAFRPGVMKRLGLGYDTLSAINPRLIYCAISGYGQTGPGAERPAYAPLVHAASGYELANMGYQQLDRPGSSGVFFADVMCGIQAAAAIEAALLRRVCDGKGEFIDATLMDTMLNLLVYEFQEAQFPVEKQRLVYAPLRAQDGFVLITPITQRNFEAMADAMGHEEWKQDARFETSQARERNWKELMDLAEVWTQERSAAVCEEAMLSGGVPCARYRTVRDLLDDPQAAARGSFAQVKDGAGTYLVPNLPFSFRNSRVQVGGHVPSLGEHSQQILEEVLRLSPEEALRFRSIVAN
jgi:CoA:oxalate CoA-transferase